MNDVLMFRMALLRRDLPAAAEALQRIDILQSAPEAERQNMHGRLAMMSGDWGLARACLAQAITDEPGVAEHYALLAVVQVELGDLDIAIETARAAIHRDADYAPAWVTMGTALCLLGYDVEGAGCFERALTLAPDAKNVQQALGRSAYTFGFDEVAAGHFHCANRDGDWPYGALGGATALLRSGRWDEGWRLYEARWLCPREPARWWRPGMEIYQGDLAGLDGKRVLVRAEQGFGDTIQFARFVERFLEVANVVAVEVQPPLRRLLRGIAPVVIAEGRPLPEHDVIVPLMSLPRLLGTAPDTVPPPVHLAAATDERLENLVGLCWAGDPRPNDPHAAAIDRRRSLSREAFEPIVAACPEWVSLQRADMNVTDFHDTAIRIARLALVITVDTSIAHLAASLGVETWLLNRFDSCWRWGMTGADTPWYPSMRIFRQKHLHEWNPVILTVVDALKDRFNGT